MNIGVDAGALSIRDNRLKVGVYRVTVGIVNALAARPEIRSVILYGFDGLCLDDIRDPEGKIRTRILRPSVGFANVRLPLQLFLDKPDCFIGASQVLPPFLSVPSVGCVYDVSFLDDPDSYPGSFAKLKAETERLLSSAGHILTISEWSRKSLTDRFRIDGSRITVAYPGVGKDFTVGGRVEHRQNPYFLYAGSLKRSKRIPLLVRSFARLVREYEQPVDLVLCGGEFWKDEGIDEAIVESGLGGQVVRTGYVSDTALAALYRGAVATVTLSAGEGFCLPAVESLACGCPVVGLAKAAMSESVGPGGILLSGDSEKSVSEAMLAILSDPEKRRTLATHGSSYVKKYTWENFGSRLWESVRKAVS